MRLISKCNRKIRSLLCFIDVYRKYPWFVPLKVKKDITITKTFQKTSDKTSHKPKKYGRR